MQIFAAPGNTIGGSAIGAGNVISGNTLSGVSLNFSGAAGNFVYGNLIGTQGDATTPLPNGLSGVTIAFNASSNRIGGPSPGQGNVIAGNTDDGITVESGVNDRLSGNSYFANGGLAIDLGPDGVQPPDVGDGDSGANLLQNYPYLAAVASDGATTTSIAGSLSSTANATFTVELYASAGCDASGHGEGTTYLGSTTILADASGAAAFLTTLPVGVAERRDGHRSRHHRRRQQLGVRPLHPRGRPGDLRRQLRNGGQSRPGRLPSSPEAARPSAQRGFAAAQHDLAQRALVLEVGVGLRRFGERERADRPPGAGGRRRDGAGRTRRSRAPARTSPRSAVRAARSRRGAAAASESRSGRPRPCARR